MNSTALRIETENKIETPIRSDIAIERVKNCAKESMKYIANSRGFQKLSKGEVSINEYKQILQEIYYQTRETPGLMGQLGFALTGSRRAGIKMMYKHAVSEFGHEELALKDLAVLGVDRNEVVTKHPLPATSALIGYAHYQITRMNPVGFVGFIYFLEFLPSSSGKSYAENLMKAGVPESAMSFLADHTEIDVAHARLINSYVETMVKTESDLEAVMYGIKTTATLYAEMISSAIDNASGKFERGEYAREQVQF